MNEHILPEPQAELKQLSETLTKHLIAEITAQGPLTFAQYMQKALYEPGLGYYSGGSVKLGPEGDFTTAPELGSVFARSIGQAIEPVLNELSDDAALLEIGAGSGALARDLIGALGDQAPSRYFILEPSADLMAVQKETLAAIPPSLCQIEWLTIPPDNFCGVLIGNEVIDALPVELFRWSEHKVEQAMVGYENGVLKLLYQPAEQRLADAVNDIQKRYGSDWPPGYVSEIHSWLKPWILDWQQRVERGVTLWFDYGYPAQDYYLADRQGGTLRCFYRHRLHNDALFMPGLQDITASVDFTALAQAGSSAGMELLGYTTLSGFVLTNGLGAMADWESIPNDTARLALAQEIKTLTLPGEMGERFQVMAFGKGVESVPTGLENPDLRYRL